MSPLPASALHEPILDWYAEHARDLPWRSPGAGAWSVMVSEFMLQQTPVARVLPVHAAWLEQWPTPADLAAEAPGEAVRAWGRLGYPRRALRLHAAASAIVERHGGEVPASYDDLLALPGVGDYTAAAIAAFAYGRRHVVLDTNVRRVLARTLAGAEFPAASVTKAERTLAEGALPEDEATAATWSVAVMELGALVCTAANPRCGELPGRRPVRVAHGRPPGVRRAAPEGADLGGHRPAVPRPAAGGGPRHRRAGARQPPGRGVVRPGPARRAASTACSPTVCSSGPRARPTPCPDRQIAATASATSRTTRPWSGSSGASGRSSSSPMNVASSRFAARRAARRSAPAPTRWSTSAPTQRSLASWTTVT